MLYTKEPTYLEDQCLAHDDEFPSTQVPCLKLTAITLAFQTRPSPPSTPLAQYYITTLSAMISIFLIRNKPFSMVHVKLHLFLHSYLWPVLLFIFISCYSSSCQLFCITFIRFCSIIFASVSVLLVLFRLIIRCSITQCYFPF